MLSSLFLTCNKVSNSYYNKKYGKAFGTTYSVQFYDLKEKDFSDSYDSIIEEINQSLSTYRRESLISNINNGDTILVDQHFKNVFSTSKRIYNETSGAFDPTIGSLVNAWDFGPKQPKIKLDRKSIKDLLQLVGFDKVALKNDQVFKTLPGIFIDFNALAKGYAVDVFADFLVSKKIKNFLVEIGGEIVAKGQNINKNKPWKIGIENPHFDASQSYSKIISIENQAMATSGTYRKFKTDSLGNRFAHIIDTKTGYPSRSKLLSVSILYNTCMEADAYATSLMSMGLEKAISFLDHHHELKAFFIYVNEANEIQSLSLNGFP